MQRPRANLKKANKEKRLIYRCINQLLAEFILMLT